MVRILWSNRWLVLKNATCSVSPKPLLRARTRAAASVSNGCMSVSPQLSSDSVFGSFVGVGVGFGVGCCFCMTTFLNERKKTWIKVCQWSSKLFCAVASRVGTSPFLSPIWAQVFSWKPEWALVHLAYNVLYITLVKIMCLRLKTQNIAEVGILRHQQRAHLKVKGSLKGKIK